MKIKILLIIAIAIFSNIKCFTQTNLAYQHNDSTYILDDYIGKLGVELLSATLDICIASKVDFAKGSISNSKDVRYKAV
jgi:hypothetical protein